MFASCIATSPPIPSKRFIFAVKSRSVWYGVVLTNPTKCCTVPKFKGFFQNNEVLQACSWESQQYVLCIASWSLFIPWDKYSQSETTTQVDLWGESCWEVFLTPAIFLLIYDLRLLRVKANWKNHLRGDCCVYKWQLCVMRQLVLSFLRLISKACGCVVLSGFIPTEDSGFRWTQGHALAKRSQAWPLA